MTFTTRLLEPEDKDALVALATQRNTLMKHQRPEDFNEVMIKSFDRYLDPNVLLNLAWGTFDSETNELLSAVLVVCWQNFPYFNINYIFSKPMAENLTPKGPLILNMKAMLTWAYQQKLYRFYIVKNEGNDEGYFSKPKHLVPELKDWFIVVEDVIEPNQKSRWPFIWNLMGQRIWDFRIVVYSYTLKQSARHTSDIFGGLDESN